MQQRSESLSPTPPPTGANEQSNKAAGSLPKDKACPFCNQPFTSSSLGRHLDLYIKEKNPKPPDGIHKVDEIRAMRGKITRRQPKGSGTGPNGATTTGQKRKADDDAEESPSARPGHGRVSLNSNEPGRYEDTRNTAPGQNIARDAGASRNTLPNGSLPPETHRSSSLQSSNGPSVPLNEAQHRYIARFPPDPSAKSTIFSSSPMHWQATGVIPDLPSTVRSPPGSNQRQPPARETSSTHTSNGPSPRAPPEMPTSNSGLAQHSGDPGAIATAALRDVLHSLQRAHTRITQPTAFDFDPLSMNYPALCLRILPPPESLFSSTPMEPATNPADYWPLRDPPSAAHKRKLMQNIRTRIKMHTALCPPSELRFAKSRAEVDAEIVVEAERRAEHIGKHVDAALQQWDSFSPSARDEVWRLELLRLCSKQQSSTYDLERKLERTQDFVEELRGELGRLREMNVKLAAQARGEPAPPLKNGLINGTPDASRPSVGPVVDSAMSRELEEMWAVGSLGGGGGWMDGAGSDKWDFDNILKRYRALLEAGSGPDTLWPGDAWRNQHVDRLPGFNDSWRQTQSQSLQRPQREDSERNHRGNGPFAMPIQDAPMIDYSNVDLPRLTNRENGEVSRGSYG